MEQIKINPDIALNCGIPEQLVSEVFTFVSWYNKHPSVPCAQISFEGKSYYVPMYGILKDTVL